MNIITIEDFRCFSKLGAVPLRPLTVIVGENSSGKSSFLAAVRLAWDIGNSARPLDFNEEPFLLGAYDQIAHFRGGRAGRAHSFKLGFSVTQKVRNPRPGMPQQMTVRHSAEFARSGSHPVIVEQTLNVGGYHFAVKFHQEKGTPNLTVSEGEKEIIQIDDVQEVGFRSRLGAPIDWSYLIYVALSRMYDHGSRRDGGSKLDRNKLTKLETVIVSSRLNQSHRPVAIAPVRTRPLRTYNPVSETPLPEGDHVPMVLAKTYFSNRERWRSLKSDLERFGLESGLFSELKIKALGRNESDPFQIGIRTNGPAMNLVDVGYGVSQVLPILVDSLLANRGDQYLLQQPEVHLHPRAQAALGSFLLRLVRSGSRRFVVETHSDYLLDRIRMDIRDSEEITADQVLILFFERKGLEVNVSPMTIDNNGNLTQAPPTYRKFFLAEERRFLDTQH